MERQIPDNRFFPGNVIVAEQLRIFQHNLHQQQLKLDTEQVSLTQRVEQQQGQIASQATKNESLSSKLRSDLDVEKQTRIFEVEELRGLVRDLSSRHTNALANADKRYDELLEATRRDREAQETRLAKLEAYNYASEIVHPEAQLHRQSAQNQAQLPAPNVETQPVRQLHFDPIETPLSTVNTARFETQPPPPPHDPLNADSDGTTTQRQSDPTRPLSRLCKTPTGLIFKAYTNPSSGAKTSRPPPVRTRKKTPRQQSSSSRKIRAAGRGPEMTLAAEPVGVPDSPPRPRTRSRFRMEGATLDKKTLHEYPLERRPNTPWNDPPLPGSNGSCEALYGSFPS